MEQSRHVHLRALGLPLISAPDIVVAQPGARLHYAVPQTFARAGRLARLLTDIHADHAFLQPLEKAGQTFGSRALKGLLGRRLPPELPKELVLDFPIAALARSLAPRIGDRGCSDLILKAMSEYRWTAENILYTVLINEDLGRLPDIKAKGVRIVHECIIGPDVGQILLEEAKLFPALSKGAPAAEVEAGRALDRRKYELADLILVPSLFTRQAVAALGAPDSKIAVVPYGLDTGRFRAEPATEPGRILFVGEVGARKGSHYLAEACRILRSRGRNYFFRVAGNVHDSIRDLPELKGPTYLGHVPRSQIIDEFRKADLFVLPTLADSFSLAHLEALSLGVPVVTTPNCGSVIQDGVEGFLAPIRDAAGLADRIESIVEDRALRASMSAAATAAASMHSMERYATRLLAAIDGVTAPV